MSTLNLNNISSLKINGKEIEELRYIINELTGNTKIIWNKKSNKISIKLLSIGNSFSEDTLVYAPYILENLFSLNSIELDLTLGIVYIGGSSIDTHINGFNSSHDFHLYTSSTKGWNTTSSTTKNAVLKYNWDYISVQQTAKNSFNSYSYDNLSNLINLVKSNNSSAEICMLLPKVRLSVSDYKANNFANVVKMFKNAAQSNGIRYIIPSGTAIENARTNTTLRKIATKGSLLTSDDTHSQNGIPRLVEAYAAVQSILNMYGIDIVIEDDTTTSSSSFFSKSYGGITNRVANGETGLTSSNINLAKKCASNAAKNPYLVPDYKTSGYNLTGSIGLYVTKEYNMGLCVNCPSAASGVTISVEADVVSSASDYTGSGKNYDRTYTHTGTLNANGNLIIKPGDWSPTLTSDNTSTKYSFYISRAKITVTAGNGTYSTGTLERVYSNDNYSKLAVATPSGDYTVNNKQSIS